MSALGEARAWLRAVILRRRAEREMHAEMAAHIEQAAERFVARGMSERDALHAARREFGSVSVIQEQARDSRGGRWVEQVLTDVRYAFRYFAKTPLTTLTIVFTLMLGVGINSAGFALFQALYFQPPPGVPNDPSLVMIRGSQLWRGEGRFSTKGGELMGRQFSYRELAAYAAEPAFASVAGWIARSAIVEVPGISNEDGVREAIVSYVTPNYFATLGMPLVAGAGFMERRFDAPETPEFSAVISQAFAREQFGSELDAVGKHVNVNDIIFSIVAVAPQRFAGIGPYSGGNELWIPLSAMLSVERTATLSYTKNDSGHFEAIARLRTGVSMTDAALSARRIGLRDWHVKTRGVASTGASTELIPLLGNLRIKSRSDQAEFALQVLGLLTLDLIIVLLCTTTVGSLLAGAAITRRHEIGVRLALGASRTRLVRQLLTESTIVALAGGAGGLLIFVVLHRLYASELAGMDSAITWSTALFTVLFAAVVALLCGMSPALHATRHALADVLKSSSANTTSRARLQRTFVVAQVALAQPLLVCLAMLSVATLQQFDKRSEKSLEDRLVIAEFNTWTARNAAGSATAFNLLRERIAAIPGVDAAILRSGFHSPGVIVPISIAANRTGNGRGESFTIMQTEVAPEYFATMDVPIVEGRTFTTQDGHEHGRPIIVSSDFAETVFGGGRALGRQVCLSKCLTAWDTLTVVGVVSAAAIKSSDDSNGRALQVFSPLTNEYVSSMYIRTRMAGDALIATVRATARAEAPKLPIRAIETVARRNERNRDAMVQISSLIASGGFATLLLGSVGLYAVVALAVGQRRREIGIRIALGARHTQVVAMFFRDGLRLSLYGLAIGLPLSAAIIRVLAMQAGMPRTNTLAIATAIALLVVLVASVATWMPARRAAGVDPTVALRAE